jgi:uncharacterized protein with GYD domain
MEDAQRREQFDTGLTKIGHEIKSQLVRYGFFGIVNCVDIVNADDVLDGSTIAITVKGRTAQRSFSRRDIEGCCLRVGGAVLSGILSMVEELSK